MSQMIQLPPMIEITTLQGVPPLKLLEAFNEAFAEYFVPLRLTENQLMTKIRSEKIQPDLSVVLISGNRVVGFILHGIYRYDGHLTAYNAGTGVIPAFRGRQYTAMMYQFILPRLRNAGVGQITLEVITENRSAFKIYSSLGFVPTRTLDCYTGSIKKQTACTFATIKPLELKEWEESNRLSECQPSWQNSDFVIRALFDEIGCLGIYLAKELAGYVVYNRSKRRILQFAVDHRYRRRGLGSALFSAVSEELNSEISIINVDDRLDTVRAFLESQGLKRKLSQYEMKLSI